MNNFPPPPFDFTVPPLKRKASGPLTDDEAACLNRWMLWGSDGYPISKRGRHWWVVGYREDLGKCPIPFKTKREAQAQWQRYIDVLIARKAGRL